MNCEWSTYDNIKDKVLECPDFTIIGSKWCAKHRQNVKENGTRKITKEEVDKLRE